MRSGRDRTNGECCLTRFSKVFWNVPFGRLTSRISPLAPIAARFKLISLLTYIVKFNYSIIAVFGGRVATRGSGKASKRFPTEWTRASKLNLKSGRSRSKLGHRRTFSMPMELEGKEIRKIRKGCVFVVHSEKCK